MDLSFFDYSVVFTLIMFAGFVDSIAGGGGFITVPTYLAIGLPGEFILGTNKSVSSVGTFVAVVRYIRSRTVIWRAAGPGAAFAFFASALGAYCASWINELHMVLILVVVVPLVMLLNYLRRNSEDNSKLKSFSNLQLILRTLTVGGLIGFYDGIYGPGTGAFLIVAHLFILKTNLAEGAANGRVLNLASNVGALLVFWGSSKIYFPITAVGVVGAMTGNYLGSGLAIQKAGKIIKPVFNIVLFILLFKCIYDFFLKTT